MSSNFQDPNKIGFTPEIEKMLHRAGFVNDRKYCVTATTENNQVVDKKIVFDENCVLRSIALSPDEAGAETKLLLDLYEGEVSWTVYSDDPPIADAFIGTAASNQKYLYYPRFYHKGQSLDISFERANISGDTDSLDYSIILNVSEGGDSPFPYDDKLRKKERMYALNFEDLAAGTSQELAAVFDKNVLIHSAAFSVLRYKYAGVYTGSPLNYLKIQISDMTEKWFKNNNESAGLNPLASAAIGIVTQPRRLVYPKYYKKNEALLVRLTNSHSSDDYDLVSVVFNCTEVE